MNILNDFTTTVVKALAEIDPKWYKYSGLVVCGTHTPTNVEYMLGHIRYAREHNEPFLGICFGHQLAWIEYCRNVLGIKNATSEEFYKGQHLDSMDLNFVVVKRPELKVGLHEGETWWSNYQCAEDNWPKADNFITVPFHPEYQSSKDKPHPLLVKFLDICKSA